MYSDFVGVTYNKTHAKYQACITHYRKQHYLGRYKLAVDAALAYDESARLLKGSSWKVNFRTRHDYEEAKFRELESVGKMGGSAVDVAGSLAAVALKVEEIASNVGQSRALRKVLLSSTHVGFNLSEGNGYGTGRKCINGFSGGKKGRRLLGLPPTDSATSILAMTKVTPSPTLQMSSLPEKPEFSSLPVIGEVTSLETPLPASPNPTRHTMGNQKSTPDSAIRPTILTYKQGKKFQLSAQVKAETPLPLRQLQLESRGDTTWQEVMQSPDPRGSMPVENPYLYGSHESGPEMWNSGVKLAAMKPPVIQNGTLAAASALMTLFGNE